MYTPFCFGQNAFCPRPHEFSAVDLHFDAVPIWQAVLPITGVNVAFRRGKRPMAVRRRNFAGATRAQNPSFVPTFAPKNSGLETIFVWNGEMRAVHREGCCRSVATGAWVAASRLLAAVPRSALHQKNTRQRTREIRRALVRKVEWQLPCRAPKTSITALAMKRSQRCAHVRMCGRSELGAR